MLFGSSGIRRKMTDDSFKFFEKISKAIGTYFPNGSNICIACDTRLSGEKLKGVVKNALVSCGINVIDLGVLPTTLLAFSSSRFFDGGVMITASHNPKEYNGIKVFNSNGLGFTKDEQKKVEEIFKLEKFRNGKGEASYKRDVIEYYENELKKVIAKEKIPIRTDLRILLDPANGAMSGVALKILKDIGMNVEAINNTPDGNFPNHQPEPKEETLKKTIELSKDYDFSACFDGDGDRVVFCDGKFYGYNEGITAVSKFYGANKVVTTVETGELIDDYIKDVIRVPVGDVNVAEGVLKNGADIGVEQVGHYIFPDIGPFPDTIFPIIIFASKFEYRKFNEKFYYTKYSIEVKNKYEVMKKLNPNLFSKLNPEKIIDIDGFRLEWKDSWSLVRPSGTEPLIRIIVESKSESKKELILEELKKIVGSVI